MYNFYKFIYKVKNEKELQMQIWRNVGGDNMLAAERQAMIVELIKENGSVQVDELAKELNVSS